MKPNKTFLKRIKITKTGKMIGRAAGQDHFNAKEKRRKQFNKKRGVKFIIKNKIKSRYLG